MIVLPDQVDPPDWAIPEARVVEIARDEALARRLPIPSHYTARWHEGRWTVFGPFYCRGARVSFQIDGRTGQILEICAAPASLLGGDGFYARVRAPGWSPGGDDPR